MRENKLVALPESIKRLNTLFELDLNNNPKLGNIAVSIGLYMCTDEGQNAIREFLDQDYLYKSIIDAIEKALRVYI